MAKKRRISAYHFVAHLQISIKIKPWQIGDVSRYAEHLAQLQRSIRIQSGDEFLGPRATP